ncbi:MAG: hypothetical protein RL488_1150 [Actinomycetota bacterium]
MSQSTMRGMRLGAQSLEATSGIVFSERSDYTYICAKGHETVLTFAAEAELPQTWQCKACSAVATLQEDGKSVILEETDDKGPRTHWEMILERRTREELEEILAERLEIIRARRASAKGEA